MNTPSTVSRRRLLRLAGAALVAAATAPLLSADRPLAATASRPAFPELDGFQECYGIRVSYIGDDGAMIALGHHDKRVVIAAMNRHARTYCGLENMLDDPRAGYHDVERGLSECWAVELHDRCLECGDNPECRECHALRNRPAEEWCLRWGIERTPGSFPVMIWNG